MVRLFTFGCLGDEVDGPGLGPESLAGAVDPDVHALGLGAGLLEPQVPGNRERKQCQFCFS